jgi:hypothetical protein
MVGHFSDEADFALIDNILVPAGLDKSDTLVCVVFAFAVDCRRLHLFCLLSIKKQGALDRMGRSGYARWSCERHSLVTLLETLLWCQSRSLFIRTMTVGPGISPGLLTLLLQALAG